MPWVKGQIKTGLRGIQAENRRMYSGAKDLILRTVACVKRARGFASQPAEPSGDAGSNYQVLRFCEERAGSDHRNLRALGMRRI